MEILPLLWLVVALAVFRMKAWKATAAALAIGIAEALLLHRAALPATALPGVIWNGVSFALFPICLVIFAALYVYAVTVESGAMAKIRSGLAAVSDDRRVLALLIVWGFGNFMEGMAGFGTAVAIPASILVGIGFDPLKSVVMCLVANTTATAFGSVGVPLLTLAGVGNADPQMLAWTTVAVEGGVTLLTPFLILLVLDGPRALRGSVSLTLLSSVAFVLPWLFVARVFGYELPDIAGGIGVMVAVLLWSLRGRHPSAARLREQAWAWLPFGLVVAVLSCAAFLPKAAKPYCSPGVLIFAAGTVGAFAQRLRTRQILGVAGRQFVRYWPVFLTICCVLALAKVMGAAGMIAAIARAIVSATGRAYPFFAPLVGALGSFATGSGTSACVLFGGLQADAAARLGLSPNALLAANIFGAGIGKIVCPQSIAIGTAAAGLVGGEGRVLRSAAPWFALVLLLACLTCGLMPSMARGAADDAIHASDSHALVGCPQYWTPAGDDTWVGDVVVGTYRGRLHVFYLKDRHHHRSSCGMGCHWFAHLSAKDDLSDWMEHPDAVPLTAWWQSLGTGTPFVRDGKLCLAYGYHTERVANWKDLKLPAGATWAESDDAVHFRPSGVIFHETRNPTVFNRPDGRFGLVLGYNGMGGMFASDDLLTWEVVDEKLPGRGDCPCYFVWNGHHYLIQGFDQMFHSASGKPGTWENWSGATKNVYEGLAVPMVCEIADGRRLMAGWLMHPVGWGGWLVFRELKQAADGRLATCWPQGLATPVIRPDVYRFAAKQNARIAYRTVQGRKPLALVIDAAAKTAAWFGGEERKAPCHGGDFTIGQVDGLDEPYEVKVAVWYDERHDVTIFDAEIAGRRTLVTRRYSRYEREVP